MEKLSPEKRSAIAKNAVTARELKRNNGSVPPPPAARTTKLERLETQRTAQEVSVHKDITEEILLMITTAEVEEVWVERVEYRLMMDKEAEAETAD
jgi:hypothetical protein